MKILFQNRDKASWIGGDMIQLEQTQKALEKLGFETRFSDKMIANPNEIVDVDWVHCFNFSMPWTKYQIWNAKKLGKKVACSMIYHETDEFVDYPTQQAMINELDAAIFLTEGELQRALRHLKIPEKIIYIIPNGIEKWWFEPVPAAPYKVDVLTVGRIDANKGQLAVAQACKKLGLEYWCIGETSRYADLVRAEGANVLPQMTPEGLKPYYAACKIYAQASYKEIMPLTVMEAGSQGKNILLTTGCEWKIPCERVDYNNVDQIVQGIQNLFYKGPNVSFRRKLKDMTWSSVAHKLKKIYETNH